jgi:murein L,D-transpeptidase YcbB/YkuD
VRIECRRVSRAANADVDVRRLEHALPYSSIISSSSRADMLTNRRSLRNILIAVLTTLPIALISSLALRSHPSDGEISLLANITDRTLTVRRSGEVVKVYDVAVGTGKHPTPTGAYSIRKIVWNPAWIPPDRAWAREKVPQGPGDPDNPMKVVKIFFREPDFFIHGTGATGSLGTAASHGCLRMDPDQAAELALMLMEDNGVARDWDWVKGILHMGESRTVSLDRSVPMDVIE